MAAHRGAHGPQAPPNSLAAIEHAIALGADMVEIDVRRDADGRLVLVHDAQVDGTAVAALSTAQLAARLGHEPARLPDALALARGRLAVNVELKEDGYVAEALDAVLAAAPAPHDVLVTSFLDGVVAQVARHAPSLPLGLLVEEAPESAIARAHAVGAGALSMSLALADGGLLAAAADAGLACVVWEVDADADLARLVADPRVAAVITDRPRAALRLRG